MKIITAFFVGTFLFASSSVFSAPIVSYLSNIENQRVSKSKDSHVDVYMVDQSPSRAISILGVLTAESDGNQTEENLMQLATAKAIELGADFVKIKTISTRNKITKRIGGAAFIAFAASSETEAKSIPKMAFSLGIYNKSSTGILWNTEAIKSGRFVVSGFRSYSLAESNGIMINDEFLEINGMLMTDKRLLNIMAESTPGAVLKVFINRDGKRANFDLLMAEAM